MRMKLVTNTLLMSTRVVTSVAREAVLAARPRQMIRYSKHSLMTTNLATVD